MSWSLLAPSLAWMVRRGRRALRFLELSPAPVPEVRRLAASVDHLSQGLGAGAERSVQRCRIIFARFQCIDIPENRVAAKYLHQIVSEPPSGDIAVIASIAYEDPRHDHILDMELRFLSLSKSY